MLKLRRYCSTCSGHVTYVYLLAALAGITGSPKQEKKMSKSSCFFGEFLVTPCSSYNVGDIDIDEITTIDRCTGILRDICKCCI